MPRNEWHQGFGVANGVSRIPGRLLEYADLTLACGALRGWTNFSLATRGNNMKRNQKQNLESSRMEDLELEESRGMEDWELSFIPQKSFCEEAFGGQLDVIEEQDTSFRSEVRGHKLGAKASMEKGVRLINKMEQILKKMEDFCGTKRSMYKPITTGIDEAFEVIEEMRRNTISVEGWFNSFEYQIGEFFSKKVREAKNTNNLRETVSKLTQTEVDPVPGKREREATVSPQETAAKRPFTKKLKTCASGAGETPRKKQEQKAKPPPDKPAAKKEILRRARPEAILVKPAQGQSYAQVLKDLKCKIKPDTLGVKIKGVRQTRSGDVLIEVKSEGEGRSKLSSAIRGAVGEAGYVRELVPRTEVEILDLDETTEEGEIKEALKRHFGLSQLGDVKVNLTKKAFRGNLKGFVELSEELAARLTRTGHLKVGWVSCRVRNKTQTTRCYRCHGYGHLAAKCEGPDRTNGCWKCGKEGHRSAACENAPQCYLCATKEGKPRIDHRPGTMRCLAFREAASLKKPQGRTS